MNGRLPAIIILAIGCLLGCPKGQTDAGSTQPVPAGSFQPIEGSGVVEAGNNPDTRVLVHDETMQKYCIVAPHDAQVDVGDRVQFRGKGQATLPLMGENCMRLDIEMLKKTEGR